MGLDLELVIVPPEIEIIRAKAEKSPDYGAEVSFLPNIIRDEKYLSRYWNEYPHTREFTDDAINLKSFYSYSEDDFFIESSRESSTLDYLSDKLLADYDSLLPKSILWDGGDIFAEYARGGQGVSIKIYRHELISEINKFLSPISGTELLENYDYEQMQEEGVYKLQTPDRRKLLLESFGRIKSLFKRAAEKNCFILKLID